MKKESLTLRFLYSSFIGRVLLKIITLPIFSKFIGFFLSTRFSKLFIKRFVLKNKILLEEYEEVNYESFNAFFTRQIKKEKRKISQNVSSFIAPCDGFLKVYDIKKGLIFPVKQSYYSVSSLLQNEVLAKNYQEGYCLVFRLCVNHYHRYCYLDEGYHKSPIFIKGRLHTVRPIALENVAVFSENSREYTLLETKHFGEIIQMEVGALCVGKIKNYHKEYHFKKGEEKGLFLFGGSTIIVLVKKDQVKILNKFLENKEILVKMGEKIGEKR